MKPQLSARTSWETASGLRRMGTRTSRPCPVAERAPGREGARADHGHVAEHRQGRWRPNHFGVRWREGCPRHVRLDATLPAVVEAPGDQRILPVDEGHGVPPTAGNVEDSVLEVWNDEAKTLRPNCHVSSIVDWQRPNSKLPNLVGAPGVNPVRAEHDRV